MKLVVARRRLERDEGGTLHELPMVQQVEQLTDDMVQRAESLPSSDRVDRVERGSKRRQTITLAIVALIAIAALIWGGINSANTARVETANQLNTASITALNDARDRAIAAGVPEKDLPAAVPQPTPGANVDINAIVQAVSALVLTEVRTDPRYRGPQGGVGPDGKPCDPVDNVACIGPQGEQGQEGASGEPGTNGSEGPPGDPGAPGKDAPTPISAAFVDIDPAADTMMNDGIDCKYETSYSDGSKTSASTPDGNCEDAVA